MLLQVKDALMELTTVGSVGVDRRDAVKPACGFEYTVHFSPWVQDTLPHILNYGDLPDMVVRISTRWASRVTVPCKSPNVRATWTREVR